MRTAVLLAAVATAALVAGCNRPATTTEASTTETTAASTATSTATETTATPSALPRPPAGQWRASIVMNGGAPRVATNCVTEQEVGFDRRPEGCSEFGSHMEGGAVVTHSVCSAQGVTVNSDTRAEGDFNSRYTTTGTIVAGGQTNRINATMEYLGPCPAGGAASSGAAPAAPAGEASSGEADSSAASESSSGQ